jgi:hypothetical protein
LTTDQLGQLEAEVAMAERREPISADRAIEQK